MFDISIAKYMSQLCDWFIMKAQASIVAHNDGFTEE